MRRYICKLVVEVLLALSTLEGGPDLTDAFETIMQSRQEGICSFVRRLRR